MESQSSEKFQIFPLKLIMLDKQWRRRCLYLYSAPAERQNFAYHSECKIRSFTSTLQNHYRNITETVCCFRAAYKVYTATRVLYTKTRAATSPNQPTIYSLNWFSSWRTLVSLRSFAKRGGAPLDHAMRQPTLGPKIRPSSN